MSRSYTNLARASRRVSWFLLFLIGVALTVTLYFVKTHSQSAKREVRVLSQAIQSEVEAIRVLKAELAYLESPARLSGLNGVHSDMQPTAPKQEISNKDIEVLFPLIGEGEAK